MEFLSGLDNQVFYFINHLPHTTGTDFFAQAFSGFGYAWILWFIISVILFLRKEKKDHWFWVPLGIALVLCYGLSELMFKNIVSRARPDMLTSTIVVGAIPGSFSFPSTHATVAFAFAYLFSRKELHWKWIYTIALLVGLSRIYLGHHYPLDVAGGMLLGTIIGMISMLLDDYLHRTKHRIVKHSSKKRGKQV